MPGKLSEAAIFNDRWRYHVITIYLIAISACAPKSTPYENGPVMSERKIKKTFEPILKFMQYRPGMVFADVGAGSGAFTVMMAALMDSSTVYIQDIDTTILRAENVHRIIDYYSKNATTDHRHSNSFTVTIGTHYRSNLPDGAFDLIYSNATLHCFASLDSMAIDLRRKLHPGGAIYFRDSFRSDRGSGICRDPKCARPLMTIEECIATVDRNGFRVIRHHPKMSGYPVVGLTPKC